MCSVFCRPSWIFFWTSSAARSVFLLLLIAVMMWCYRSHSSHLARPKHLQFPPETHTASCPQSESSMWWMSWISVEARGSCCYCNDSFLLILCAVVSLLSLHVSPLLAFRAPVLFAALSQTWRWSATSLRELRFSRSCSALVSIFCRLWFT